MNDCGRESLLGTWSAKKGTHHGVASGTPSPSFEAVIPEYYKKSWGLSLSTI